MIFLLIVAVLTKTCITAVVRSSFVDHPALLARRGKVYLGGFSLTPATFGVSRSHVDQTDRLFFSAITFPPPIESFSGMPAV
jgi:hypothetical protein